MRALAASCQQFFQAFAVVRMELLHPGLQAGERAAVRGQYQGFGGQWQKAVNRLQKGLQRVGLGLLHIDANVGGDTWQQHVAANQHTQCFAVQGHVFIRVAETGDAAPLLCPDANALLVLQAVVLLRHAGHQGLEIVAADH